MHEDAGQISIIVQQSEQANHFIVHTLPNVSTSIILFCVNWYPISSYSDEHFYCLLCHASRPGVQTCLSTEVSMEWL